MKKIIIITSMALCISAFNSCANRSKESAQTDDFKWIVDTFDDIKVLRYQVSQFDSLSLNEKLLVYYLSEAALCGRDIFFDQNCKYNLTVRRVLEGIYSGYDGQKDNKDFRAFEKYLKKVWFANGIHHHYSTDKFQPEFSESYFRELIASTPKGNFPKDISSADIEEIIPVIFDPAVMPKRVNQTEGEDMVATSANNFYEGLTQAEVEDYYASVIDSNDPTPISYGLNSKMVKDGDKIVERTWKVGGMYSESIERIVYWLKKAAEVAGPQQKETINHLIAYYTSGDLKQFDKFNINWVKDTLSKVDFVNGFTETYGDPLGYRAAWESLINFRDDEATKRTTTISEAAQWFEDNSPIDPKYKKKEVKGVSAKVIVAAMLGGDCYPATPIGINLPNADWIRRDYGSKSVTIQNITNAYTEASKGGGFADEFILRDEDRELYKKYGSMGDNLHTDLHECLGHGSGQLAVGVRGDELKNYGSPLEEARADLFALYYIGDPKMAELGLVPSFDVAKATYANYIMNGMMTQLSRVELGKDVEQAHMRCRKLIAEWCYDNGQGENVIEKVVKNGKTYIVVNDFDKLRGLFAQLLIEVQRIKSEGDFEAGKELMTKYAIKIDPQLHAEVLERCKARDIKPYSGFVNPVYHPVMEGGNIIDVKVEYNEPYVDQMLRYSKEYSYLPSKN